MKSIQRRLIEILNSACRIDFSFVSKAVLASHIRGVHEFAFAHVCDICARVFKSKHVFQNHMQEHSTTTRPKMQCNVCGAW